MRKVIKASASNRVIFEDENFEFVIKSGIGINDTPWTGLEVKSKGLADKHVVEIRLNTEGWPKFEGHPVTVHYSNAYVAHGMRSTSDTLNDTREYIAVLEDAVDFAERVNKWLSDNDKGKSIGNQAINNSSSCDSQHGLKNVSASESDMNEYVVTVNFAGYIGADEDFTIYAEDEESAINQAVEDAKDCLEVTSVEQDEDDETSWTVSVGYCGFIGVEQDYQVDGVDNEDDAAEDALAQAAWDLTGEISD